MKNNDPVKILFAWFTGLLIIFVSVYSYAHIDNDSCHNQYNNGFLDGFNGTLEEYNYSVSYIEYRNNDNSLNVFKDGNQGYNEGFIDGYRKRQLDIKKEKMKA